MHKIIPLGDRIICKRRRVGDKAGTLYLPDQTSERPTDLADVTYLPELSFADSELIDNAEQIVNSLISKASNGDSEALKALLEFNLFLKIKSIQTGDTILISKYIGTDLHDTDHPGEVLTIVNGGDIIGIIQKEA